MTDFLIETLDLSEFQPDRLDAIDLSAAAITAAQALSQTAPAQDQWATYRNALAAAGFEQWLRDRQLTATRSAHHWQINGFQVCPIAAPEDDEILIPQAFVQDAAHLYVAVGIDEEYDQAYILGSTRYDQLKAQSLQTEDDAYRLPIDQLDLGGNQLLLTLRCADPATIPLPLSIGQQVAAVTDQLFQAKIRVGTWLNRQLDAVAADLSWVLMPPIAAPAVGMRSTATADPFAKVLETVAQQGIELAENAPIAYYDLPMTDPTLRLHVVVGQLNPTEWSMLVVLGQTDGTALPANLQLSISDGQTTLVEQQIEVARSQSYLYTQLIGAMDEGFQVKVTLPNGMIQLFPEFVFG
jgi:Protein of unknown function (DUF1822)